MVLQFRAVPKGILREHSFFLFYYFLLTHPCNINRFSFILVFFFLQKLANACIFCYLPFVEEKIVACLIGSFVCSKVLSPPSRTGVCTERTIAASRWDGTFRSLVESISPFLCWYAAAFTKVQVLVPGSCPSNGVTVAGVPPVEECSGEIFLSLPSLD